MLKDLLQSFEKRNENAIFGVYFSNRQSQEGFHIIKVDFSGSTGRGVFSKESYDSRSQYENSDYNRLIERYCPKVNESGFQNKDWTVKVEKSAGLGDKGSLDVETIVELTLKKKQFSKAYMETLREEINKAVRKSI